MAPGFRFLLLALLPTGHRGAESGCLTSNTRQLYTLALNGAGTQKDFNKTITNGGYHSV